MKLYADAPVRRTRQVVGDLVAAAVLALGLLAGGLVWRSLHGLAERTRQLADAATTSADRLQQGVAALSDVPLVGDQLGGLLGQVGGFTDQTSGNLRSQADQLAWQAPAAGLAVIGVTVALVALFWGAARLRWIRTASALHSAGPDLMDTLALAALVADPVGVHRRQANLARRWQAGDPEAVHVLAAEQFRRHGLRAPRWTGPDGADPR